MENPSVIQKGLTMRVYISGRMTGYPDLNRPAFKRLDKRRDRLFRALCVIKTWLSFPNEKDTLYHIGKLATECIMDEKAAQAKEGAAQ